MDAQLESRLAALLTELNARHFEGRLRPPRIRLTRRLTSSAGMADAGNWTIRISVPYHDLHGWEAEAEATLVHEMIHLWLRQQGRPSGHTPEFRALAGELGAPRFAKRMPPKRQRHYRCPSCGREATYRRRVTLACRFCCDRFNDGRFTRRFLLTPA